jgi:hypothetical protein
LYSQPKVRGSNPPGAAESFGQGNEALDLFYQTFPDTPQHNLEPQLTETMLSKSAQSALSHCRDRATTRYNCLILNGVGGYSLRPKPRMYEAVQEIV